MWNGPRTARQWRQIVFYFFYFIVIIFFLRKGSGKAAGNFLRLAVKLCRRCQKRHGSNSKSSRNSSRSRAIELRPEKPGADRIQNAPSSFTTIKSSGSITTISFSWWWWGGRGLLLTGQFDFNASNQLPWTLKLLLASDYWTRPISTVETILMRIIIQVRLFNRASPLWWALRHSTIHFLLRRSSEILSTYGVKLAGIRMQQPMPWQNESQAFQNVRHPFLSRIIRVKLINRRTD